MLAENRFQECLRACYLLIANCCMSIDQRCLFALGELRSVDSWYALPFTESGRNTQHGSSEIS